MTRTQIGLNENRQDKKRYPKMLKFFGSKVSLVKNGGANLKTGVQKS